MKRENLVEFIQKDDKWYSVDVPAGLKGKVMTAIETRFVRIYASLRFYKFVAVSFAAMFIAAAGLLIVSTSKPSEIVFVYPNSGTEKKVQIVGNFVKDADKKSYSMVLDEEKGLWKTTVQTRRKWDHLNFEFVVEDDDAPDSIIQEGIDQEDSNTDEPSS